MKKIRLSIFLTILVVLSGFLVIILVVFCQSKINGIYQKNLPLIGLSENLKYKVTKGHLWFEEYMAGDQSIDPDKDVMSLFQGAAEDLKIAIEGGNK